jgi:hypothetical protein
MKPLKATIALLLSLALLVQPMLVAAATAAQGASGSQTKVTAADLLKSAERALTKTIKAAKASKDSALEPDKASGKPFWQALKKLNGALDQTDRGLSLKDDTFFRGLGTAVSAATEADVAFGLSGAKDSQVAEALDTTRNAVTLLDKQFGKGAARQKKGGQLSAKEKQQLEQIRRKQAELQGKLDEVERKAKLNQAELKRLREMRRHSDDIYRSRDTVGDFVAALFVMRMIDGLLWGCHWWWGPWGMWVGPFSYGFGDIYFVSIDIIDYDWIAMDEAVELAELGDIMDAAEVAEVIELAETADEMDAAEIEEMDEFVEDTDFSLDNQDLSDLSGVEPGEMADALERAEPVEPMPEAGEVDLGDVPSDDPLPETAPLDEIPDEAIPADEPMEAPMDVEPFEPPPVDMDLPVDDFGGGGFDAPDIDFD